MSGGLLCVHPHPDDETLACGGTIAKALAEGREVTVVTCTGGEAGENLAGIDLGGRDLAEVRREELARALAALGGPTHRWLGYRDSGMAGTPDNDHPQSFHRADLEQAARRLADVILEVRPAVVVSDPADGTYGHPDHIKAHQVTVRAVALAAARGWTVAKRYETALPRSRVVELARRLRALGRGSPFAVEDAPRWGRPDEEITTVVDVRPWLDRKRAAMAAHASQIGPESFFLNLPEELVPEVFGWEHFVWVGAPPGTAERDLFEGLD